jgi:hypothetical protein
MDADSALAAAERAITGHKPADPLGQLTASLELSRAADDRHRRAIIAARQSGATWLQIARALGLQTKQAGEQAHGRAVAALKRSEA